MVFNGTLENTFELHTGAWALVALPDNQHALSGSYDKTIKLFNVTTAPSCAPSSTTPWSAPGQLPDGLRFVSGAPTTPPASPTTGSLHKNTSL